ncbi:MAG: hypothetical protein AB7P50_04515 [Alphaproteobacteria bacterium]
MALRKIDRARTAIDQRERDREQAVNRAESNPGDEHLSDRHNHRFIVLPIDP